MVMKLHTINSAVQSIKPTPKTAKPITFAAKVVHLCSKKREIIEFLTSLKVEWKPEVVHT
jgi:hypothetical protein